MTEKMPRAKQEEDFLTRVSQDPATDVLVRVAVLLIVHRRTGPAGCACGWDRFGQLHPRHVAEVLRDAGLLAARPEGGS
jgi:hypothetical protein